MIRVPEGSEDRDIIRWLTQVFMVGEDEKVPHHLHGVQGGVVMASRVDDSHMRVTHINPDICFAHWPALGTFNVPGRVHAAHVSRQTVRQWNRSLTPELLTVRRLDALAGRDYLPAGDYLYLPYIHRPYSTPDEALNDVRTERMESVAINRRVAVGRGLCTYKVSVFVDGLLAGTVSGRQVLLYPDTDINAVLKTFGDTYGVRQLEG